MKLHNKSLQTAALIVTCLLGLCAARAEVTQNSIESFDQQVIIDCNGDGTPEDVLDLSGDLHILVTETQNHAGGIVSTAHFQPVNVSAVGSMTGDTYRAVGLTRSTDVIQGDNEAFTFINNFYLIGQRSGIKYLVHETFHVTVVNGETVVQLDHATTRCQ